MDLIHCLRAFKEHISLKSSFNNIHSSQNVFGAVVAQFQPFRLFFSGYGYFKTFYTTLCTLEYMKSIFCIAARYPAQ
ncbi:hypothetical protein BT96DRAFT_458105 [Gymnopus androsaceus JB14]|uniref:Uncharacterized protein n=1 Tax=Gymnopus androsaceus JB14 TaxID=1447944 RepID=A0A6A4IKY9_9AGAR|nr:hypothetical protein BT96DRAFT_458105 [Gymnopus androsaceus JB14]